MATLLQAENRRSAAAPFWRNPFDWVRKQNLGREFWTFFAAAFFFDAGFSVYVFLFNLYLLDCHFNERAIGLIGGAMTLGLFLGTLPAGAWAKRIGVRHLLIPCFVGSSLLGVLRAFWMWEPAQIGLALLSGLILSSWGVCYLPTVARLTTEMNRTSAFSLIFSASVGTSMLGGIVCGYLRQWLGMAGIMMQASETKRLILLVSCGIVLLGLFPVMRLRMLSSRKGIGAKNTEPDHKHWLRDWKFHPFLRRFLPLMALWSAVLAAFNPFANVYLSRDLKIPMTQIGLIYSAAQVLQLCMGLMAPVVFRMMGLVKGIAATQIAAGLLLISMATARHGGLAVALYLSFSTAQWMSSPGLYNLLMDKTPDDDRSTAAAMTLFCNALIGAAATAGAGVLFSRFGYPPVLTGISTVALVAALLFLLCMRTERRVLPKENVG